MSELKIETTFFKYLHHNMLKDAASQIKVREVKKCSSSCPGVVECPADLQAFHTV